jgi:glutamate-1-semialdehyde 2,1-aminomutase
MKATHKDVAALITEPVMGNAAAIPPAPGYLKHLRELCTRYDVMLIFDEVKTGFRLGPGGAQGLFGVKPDLSTFAKSLGNGYPIAAFGGRKDAMSLIGPGKVMHGGTYSANPISLTAAKTTLNELQKSSTWTALRGYGSSLMKGIADILTDHHLPHVVHGYPGMFQFLFTEKDAIRSYRDLQYCDMATYARIQYKLLEAGVMLDEDNEEAMYISTAHSRKDLQLTLASLESAVESLRRT